MALPDQTRNGLIARLLQTERSKRIGCLKNGAEDIKRHKWFKGFDWQAMLTYSYPSPIVPDVRGEGDTHNFDKYPESIDDHTGKMVDAATSERLFSKF